MTRQPDWDVDRLRGELAELMYRVTQMGILIGEAEVKRDDRALETGNIYIEFKCLRQGEWKPSGIADTKATTWVVTCWPFVVAAPTWMVRNIARDARDEGKVREQIHGSHPTAGVVISLTDFLPRLAQEAAKPLEEAA